MSRCGEGLALVQPQKARDPAGLPELERGKALSAVLLEDAEGVDVGVPTQLVTRNVWPDYELPKDWDLHLFCSQLYPI